MGKEGGWEGRKEVVQVNFIPSHLFSLLPTLSPQYEGGEIEEAEAIVWERRRYDTSVGMEEHSSQQSLSCLLPQHTHTSPCPVGVQAASGAALKGPQSLPSGKLTAVGNRRVTHNHTRTHVHTSTQDLSTQTNSNLYI